MTSWLERDNHVFFPGREWTGPSTVEIATLSALSRRPGR